MSISEFRSYDLSAWREDGMSIQVAARAPNTEVSDFELALKDAENKIVHFASAAFVAIGLMVSSVTAGVDLSVPYSSLQTATVGGVSQGIGESAAQAEKARAARENIAQVKNDVMHLINRLRAGEARDISPARSRSLAIAAKASKTSESGTFPANLDVRRKTV